MTRDIIPKFRTRMNEFNVLQIIKNINLGQKKITKATNFKFLFLNIFNKLTGQEIMFI